TEITELLAGECFEVRGSTATQCIAWNPVAIAADRRSGAGAESAQRLLDVTRRCIDAWSSVHPRILLCLSGGLDSAIILGCLAASSGDSTVICINHHADDAESDERTYARLAAERAGVTLIEAKWDATTFGFDSRMLALPPLPKPGYSQCARLMQLESLNAVVERHAADAVWKGQGGDHLFLKASGIACAADFFIERGIAPGLFRAVGDEARLASQPYASVFRSALSVRHGRRRDARNRSPSRPPCFLHPEIPKSDLDRQILHPWLMDDRALPPGKRRHVELIADVTNRHRHLPDKELAYEHHPLLSQPIIEQCLRIPTYRLLQGGRHRSLAREAFADFVPSEILGRESKGGTT
ncbi:MAG: asparagine synthase-related protein, partial [Steroidobacteraceae bacterium]